MVEASTVSKFAQIVCADLQRSSRRNEWGSSISSAPGKANSEPGICWMSWNENDLAETLPAGLRLALVVDS